jgi:hypothetical protein
MQTLKPVLKIDCACYLSRALDPCKSKVFANAIAAKINLLRKKTAIHGIVATGNSGVVMGSLVSFLTDIPLVIIRKPDEKNHSGERMVEAQLSFTHGEKVNFVIVDDLIATGSTMYRIEEALVEYFERLQFGLGQDSSPKIVGIMLYAPTTFEERFSFKTLGMVPITNID